MTKPNRPALTRLLNAIEEEMKSLSLWESQPPAAHVFESQLPFFADRMDFHQWLQWVFIARFRALIDGGHPMPSQCQIAPMAEEALKNIKGRQKRDPRGLLTLIRAFDEVFPG